MLSPTSTTRTGLYAQGTSGVSLSQAEVQALLEDRGNAVALGQAIGEAVQRARDQGLSAFTPDSDTLQAPTVPQAALRELFSEVIGVPYSLADETPALPPYGALTLQQWSQAAQALAQNVARQDSLRAAGAGGGPQYALGHWYVNGETFSTAELFMALRVGNVAQVDQELATNLNTLVANTTLARELLAVMADMKRRIFLREAEAASRKTDTEVQPPPEFPSDEDFADFVEAAGLTVPEVMDLGLRFSGPDSRLSLLGGMSLDSPPGVAGSSDYNEAVTELLSLIDSLNTENDIQKLRVDTLHNSRSAMLLGMSDFMEGALTQARTVGRNL